MSKYIVLFVLINTVVVILIPEEIVAHRRIKITYFFCPPKQRT